MFTKKSNQFYLCLLFIILTGPAVAQKLTITETEVKLSKDAKKAGSYFGGGYDHNNKATVAIFHYANNKEGVLFDVYQFNNANKAVEPKEGLTVDELAGYLKYQSTDTDQKQDFGRKYDGQRATLVRSNFIGRDIVIEKGYLNHESILVVQAKNMSNPFTKSSAWQVDKLLFKSDKKEKVKLGFMPMGSLVFEGQYEEEVLAKLQEASNEGPSSGGTGIFALGGALADQVKAGSSAVKASLNAAFMQDNGKAVMMGRVVEKVNMKNPAPWNNNRLRVAVVDGGAMEVEEKETYVFPFAFIPAETKAIKNYQQLVALLVPLNSPNTVKEAKQYQMDKENRNRVMVTVINNRGELVDTVQYRSAGNNGKYSIVEEGNAIYIPAVLNAKAGGFYNGHVPKPTHIQFTKVENGKLIYNNSYDFSAISNKVLSPKGKKISKLKVGDVRFQEHKKLRNGDMVFFAVDQAYFYAYQVGSSGELKHVYVTDRYDAKGKVVDSQFIEHGNDKLLWMTRETPEGVSDTDINVSESLSSHNDGFTRTQTTTATATPRNILEIKAVVKISAVNPYNGTIGEELQVGGKDYLVVGDSGYLIDGMGAMVMIGFDVSKRKSLYAIKIAE